MREGGPDVEVMREGKTVAEGRAAVTWRSWLHLRNAALK